MTIEEPYRSRFWTKVDKTDTCWTWTAGRANGYGLFCVNGKSQAAHRVSVILDGRDPTNSVVMHTCDNPSCVRPDHLVIGTQRENMLDMVSKNRHHMNHAKGEASGRSKLTEHDVKAIRADKHMTKNQLALKYGVHRTNIHDILKRKIWQHI